MMELICNEVNPYNNNEDCQKIKVDAVEWKAGKDVTVTKVAKKVKGGGAKKAKQKGKETSEPRDSFFRRFLCSYTADGELPEQVSCLPEAEEVDANDMVEGLMMEVHQASSAIRDDIIPFAVRWYTGEAAP